MRRHRDVVRATAHRALAAAIVAVGMVATLGVPATALPGSGVKTAATDEYTFTGHGWGHGRGMGQYGARGYAATGWKYQQILDHFYGGTSRSVQPDQVIDVELLSHGGGWVIVAGNDLRVNGAAVAGSGLDVVLVERAGANQYRLSAGTGCESGFPTTIGTVTGPVELTVPTQSGYENLVRTCVKGNEMRAYRGSIVVKDHVGTPTSTVVANRVGVENYLLGVVPHESPDWWGGESNGIEALKAQAVAARSYALAGGLRKSGAKTCDTTSCQVYLGAAKLSWTGTGYAVTASLDGPNATTAIAQTAGEVRLMADGSIARTEFSSSTGGYTVPGAFPAVEDLGDSYKNPNHNWTVTFTGARVAEKLNLAGVRSVTVTERNGLGDLGGRVTQVVVVDGAGTSHSYDSQKFRLMMGTSDLKSDWFAVSSTTSAAAQSVVKALYQDLLGRQPDPTGLAGWSAALMQGTSQSVLVGTLTRSDEYIWSRVAKAYREVLGREPDPSGAASWLNAIKAGQATVDDVQRRFYDSAEYFASSGGTPEGYVKRLYTTMLRREAAVSEISAWTAAYQQRGRAWVVDAIWFSTEAASVRAGDYYQTFLGRNPDPSGQAAWAQVLLAYGEGAVRVGIAGSLEYRSRAIARYP